MLRNAGFALLVGVTLMGWSASNGGFEGIGMTPLSVLPFLGIAVLVFIGATIRGWYWKRWGWRKSAAHWDRIREWEAQRPKRPFGEL